MSAVADALARSSYAEAMARLVAAQAEYAAQDDPSADWHRVAAACKAVVIARADLEHIRRLARRDGVAMED